MVKLGSANEFRIYDEMIFEYFVKTQSLTLIKRHNSVHSDVKEASCHVCGEELKNEQCLNSHIRQVHEKERRFPCEAADCGKRFFSKMKLEQHAKIHTGQRDFICQFCEKQFIQKTNRDTHEKRVHSTIA